MLRPQATLHGRARGRVVDRSLLALSICMEKSVVSVGNQMERAFPLEIFRKIGIPSEVFLFPRFSRNGRKFTVPFATTRPFVRRARSTIESKNAKIYPLNRFKFIQNYFDCR